jgi:hypothetical protein
MRYKMEERKREEIRRASVVQNMLSVPHSCNVEKGSPNAHEEQGWVVKA